MGPRLPARLPQARAVALLSSWCPVYGPHGDGDASLRERSTEIIENKTDGPRAPHVGGPPELALRRARLLGLLARLCRRPFCAFAPRLMPSSRRGDGNNALSMAWNLVASMARHRAGAVMETNRVDGVGRPKVRTGRVVRHQHNTQHRRTSATPSSTSCAEGPASAASSTA